MDSLRGCWMSWSCEIWFISHYKRYPHKTLYFYKDMKSTYTETQQTLVVRYTVKIFKSTDAPLYRSSYRYGRLDHSLVSLNNRGRYHVIGSSSRLITHTYTHTLSRRQLISNGWLELVVCQLLGQEITYVCNPQGLQ